MNVVAVFIGSFDPVHRGHLECAEIALARFPEIKKVVFLPNNPRKGKPDRSVLALRARWLSFSMPIFNHSDWMQKSSLKILCDTRDCNFVVDVLRDCGFKIIGLIGSDVFKTPKLIAHRWIMIERKDYPAEDAVKYFENVSVIKNSETSYQNISSSSIRHSACQSENFPTELLNENIAPYYKKKFIGNTLSYTTLSHNCTIVDGKKSFRIAYVDSSTAQVCVENLKLLKASSASTYFGLPEIVQHFDNTVYFSMLAGKTIFDLVVSYLCEQSDEHTLEEALINAFVLLQRTYFSKSIIFPHCFHCDPSAKNIIYDGRQQSLVDFENCRILASTEQTRIYYDRFSKSFEFYLALEGFERDVILSALIRNAEKKAFELNADLIYSR